jgi:hypothetical protein
MARREGDRGTYRILVKKPERETAVKISRSWDDNIKIDLQEI